MARQLHPWQMITWEKPPPSPLGSLGRTMTGIFRTITGGKPPSAFDSLRSAIVANGIPSAPGNPLQEAQTLLGAVAEVEHALLVEYLYGAWSLGTSPFADTVITIAIQEMCHLVTVQNLLLFVGSQPSFSRQDQAPSPALNPFPFSLRPFTKAVLEDFLLTEMPPLNDMSSSDRAIMQPITDSRIRQGGTVHPVGAIYAKLYWLFLENDTSSDEWPDVSLRLGYQPGRHVSSFPGAASAATFQAAPQEGKTWHFSSMAQGVFETIDSRQTALKAIFDIAAQGEGPVSAKTTQPTQPSHFRRFMDIYQDPAFASLSPPKWPTDPFAASPGAPSGTQVTHPLAAALCRIFDRRYQILLACLRASLSHDRSSPQEIAIRNKYASWAFEEMLGSLNGFVGPISQLPCQQGGSVAQLAAAPTFNLDGMVLPDDAAALDGVLLQLHQSVAADIVTALAAGPDASTAFTLNEMQQTDRGRFPN
jgi:hypothetical protein